MERINYLNKIAFEFTVNPIVAILGPRQCGKTTLAKQYISHDHGIPPENYFDLENSRDVERLKDPLLTLSALSGLIVIDEIQYVKELFPTLRVLIDDPNINQQYLILGSASGELLNQSSETLAGRISYVELDPFSFEEINDLSLLWLRGGFPKSALAASDAISYSWRKAFIKTFLEKDIPKLGIAIPSENLRRFWMMLAHYQGNLFNASEIAGALGLTDKTIKNYLDILANTFMVRILKPWHENIQKRQVKSPKIIIRDSGIFHSLIGVKRLGELLVHPKLGASWECLAMEQIIHKHQAEPEDCYFWSTYQEAELDLLLYQDGKRIGFEIKHTSSPKLTKSMQMAMDTLGLDTLTVIYPGNVTYPLSANIKAIGLKNYLESELQQP